MNETEKSTKTGADVAHFYRALGDAAADMAMPFEVHFQAGGKVMLRYSTVEDVDAAVAHIGGRAGHGTHTYRDSYPNPSRQWHSYGTAHGDGHGTDWSGWPVEVWAAVDGPAPEPESAEAVES